MYKAAAVLFFITTVMAPHSFSSTLANELPSLNARGYLFEIHGSNTIGAKLAPDLVQQWLKLQGFHSIRRAQTDQLNEQEIIANSAFDNSEIKIKIAAHGSSTGFKKIKAGHADIAASSRPIKHSENALFTGINLTQFNNETVLAIDGLAIIVDPKLTISQLTIEQIGQVFSGQVTNWKHIGGPDLDISVHARDNNSGTFDTFKALVLSRGYTLTDDAKRYESNDALAEQVASTPGAVGFTAFANVGKAKALAITDGQSSPMSPRASTIATEDYPLSRRLYFYQANTENKYALNFLSFVKSTAGQNIVQRSGFISQNLSEVNVSPSSSMPNGYKFLVERSARLTTNFRFVPGTKQLDNKAIDDIERLSAFMQQTGNEQREVFLVGFVNKQSSEFRAQILSEARVQAVKKALRQAGIKTNAMVGYGEMNPVSDNSEERYALRNQRVEVWIK